MTRNGHLHVKVVPNPRSTPKLCAVISPVGNNNPS